MCERRHQGSGRNSKHIRKPPEGNATAARRHRILRVLLWITSLLQNKHFFLCLENIVCEFCEPTKKTLFPQVTTAKQRGKMFPGAKKTLETRGGGETLANIHSVEGSQDGGCGRGGAETDTSFRHRDVERLFHLLLRERISCRGSLAYWGISAPGPPPPLAPCPRSSGWGGPGGRHP